MSGEAGEDEASCGSATKPRDGSRAATQDVLAPPRYCANCQRASGGHRLAQRKNRGQRRGPSARRVSDRTRVTLPSHARPTRPWVGLGLPRGRGALREPPRKLGEQLSPTETTECVRGFLASEGRSGQDPKSASSFQATRGHAILIPVQWRGVRGPWGAHGRRGTERPLQPGKVGNYTAPL